MSDNLLPWEKDDLFFDNDPDPWKHSDAYPSPKISAIKPGDKFYKVVSLVRIPKNEFDNWSSGCDETFNLTNSIVPEDVISYEQISEDYYKNHIHDMFSKGGGI